MMMFEASQCGLGPLVRRVFGKVRQVLNERKPYPSIEIIEEASTSVDNLFQLKCAPAWSSPEPWAVGWDHGHPRLPRLHASQPQFE